MSADLIPILTTSERRSFKKCQQQWWWGYRKGLRARDGGTAMALWFGIGIHEALAAMYQPGFKRDKDFIGVWEAYCDTDELSMTMRTEDINGEAVWVEARALGIAMLRGYVETYNWDKHWDVIAIETPFELEIPHPIDPQLTAGIFTSTYDGVYRDTRDKRIKLMEHKTAKSITLGHLPMDDQGGSYWMSANIILKQRGILEGKEKIAAITYNFLKKTMPDDRPQDENGLYLNKNGSVSKQQPSPRFVRHEISRSPKEQRKQLERIQHELLSMDEVRSGRLKPFKNPSNDTCPSCPFRDMCELEERGSDWIEFRDAMYFQKDPYDRYRKPAI